MKYQFRISVTGSDADVEFFKLIAMLDGVVIDGHLGFVVQSDYPPQDHMVMLGRKFPALHFHALDDNNNIVGCSVKTQH